MIQLAHRPTALLMAGAMVATLANLAACSRPTPNLPAPPAAAPAPISTAPATPAAQAHPYADLMRAVLQQNYRPAEGDALAELPDPDSPGVRGRYVLTPVDSTTLPGGVTVLVVNGNVADAQGNGQFSHASPGLLSVYLLRQNAGAWDVIKRHENVAALGSMGRIGTVHWVKQTGGQTMLAIEDGGTWQGHTIAGLNLFDPSADQVRNLADRLPLASTNGAACGPSTEHCWDVEGKWQFAPSASGARYDDVVMTFTGEEEDAIEDQRAVPEGEAPAAEEFDEDNPIKRKVTKIAGTARYVFDKDSYKLSSGENPVPGV